MLANKLQKAYAALKKSLPKEGRSKEVLEGTGRLVSVNELLAYQIGWGTLLISWYEAGVSDKTPVMPGEGFTSWDYNGLAAHFYQKYVFETDEEYERCLDRVVSRILEIIEVEQRSGNLDVLGVWSWCTLKSGKQWPLSKWIQVNTIAPYQRAQKLILGLS